MAHGEWPALDIPEFDVRNYARTEDYPDEFGEVTVVDPVAAQQARRDVLDSAFAASNIYEETRDDGARLDTPENHRAKAIEKMTDDNNRAEQTALRARAWATSVGYHNEYVKKINEAIEALGEAAELIDRYENR